jgi:hypothetical protein
MAGAVTGQGLEVGAFPLDEEQDPEATEHLEIPAAKTGPEQPQILEHTVRQIG